MSEPILIEEQKFTVGGDDSDKVEYVPFITKSDRGQVGYKITLLATGEVTWFFLNPSDHDNGDLPNVFVYQNATGDPVYDGALHYYDLVFDDSAVEPS